MLALSDPIAETWDAVLEEEDRAARMKPRVVEVLENFLEPATLDTVLVVLREDGSRGRVRITLKAQDDDEVLAHYNPPIWWWPPWLNQRGL